MTVTSVSTTSTRKRSCVVCGASYEAKRKDAEYCSPSCRIEFNNRRTTRGQQLYDLMMINRHDRDLAKKARVLFLITRLCMYWKYEDNRERAGRRSWRDPQKAIEGAAWARATVVDQR